MKFHNLKMTVLACSVIISIFVMYSSHSYADDHTTGPAPISEGVYHGKVVEVEEHTLVVKQDDGDIVRVRMPGQSDEHASDYQVGDHVEVIVSPQGITTSVKREVGSR